MARLLIDVLYHYRREGCFELHEFVVMPNHFHVLLTVAAQLSLERAVQRIKGGFSYRARKELEFQSEIWQRGFTGHVVRTAEDFEEHRRYIQENPVKRNLAVTAKQFQYSSAFPGCELDPAPAFAAAKAAG